MEELHDACGVAAVYIKPESKDNDKAVFYLYKLLLNLQHRGQLSAGITTYNKSRQQLIDTYKGMGMVNEVFRTNDRLKSFQIFQRYKGSKGIGHVRYATCGKDDKSYAQPFERHHGRMWKWFSFCFNGNLANYAELKKQIMSKPDYHMVLDTDTEVIMHHLSREFMGNKKPSSLKVFSNLTKKFDGSYNLAFINSYGEIIVLRDPLGNRPLSYGSRDDGIFLAASESNALANCGVEKFKSLEPGKMIIINDHSITVKRYAKSKRRAHCMFEWVYFSNVASVLDGKSVYITRTNLGKELARLETESITKEHIVVPVPDTAKAAGDAMAYELGIPSMEGLIRNRFVGRTFIEGSRREDKVQNKYTALRDILKGKKVILVDDSIVRGTTSRGIVRYIKKVGGAKEVHLRVSCPPIMAPCFYGIDMSTVSELLAPRFEKHVGSEKISERVCKKIAEHLYADSVIYQTIPGLVKSIGLPKRDLCMACLNGQYPTPCGRRLYEGACRNLRNGVKEDRRIYEVC